LLPGDVNAPVVTLAITVAPGLQYRLGAIRWSGNHLFTDAELAVRLGTHPGIPADRLALDAGLDRVRAAYAARGYLRASVTPSAVYDDATQTVGYELRLDEGSLYKFHRMEITGLSAALHDRVREVWSMREGDPFDPAYIRQFLHAAAPLLGLGVVTHEQREINDKDKTVDVVIHFDFQQPVK
jgi:outer membrane protein assembly factor BamA